MSFIGHKAGVQLHAAKSNLGIYQKSGILFKPDPTGR